MHYLLQAKDYLLVLSQVVFTTGVHNTLKCFISGYAVGFSSSMTQPLQCMPFPSDLKCGGTELGRFPKLTLAKFDLRGITSVFAKPVNNKPIRCALCHRKTSGHMVSSAAKN